MRIAAISTIRDEADIIVAFLRHLDALFDIVFLLDQRSSDGSTDVMRAACAQRPQWTYLLCDFAGRHQKESVNLLLPTVFGMGADALFFVDADEFFAGVDRRQLQRQVGEMQAQAAVGRYRWRACVPISFDVPAFDLASPAWICRFACHIEKHALSSRFYQLFPEVRLEQGYHNLSGVEKGLKYIALDDVYHFPLRSRHQYVLKTFVAKLANLARGKQMGWRRQLFLEKMAAGAVDDEALAGYASMYCQFPKATELPRMNMEWFDRAVPSIAFSDMTLPEPPRTDPNVTLARCLAEFAYEGLSEDGLRFALEGETIALYRDAPSRPEG